MSLIDSTYFVFDINIPASDYSDLAAYITRYEKEIIEKLFGYELGALVIAYNVSTSPQRIKDIVEGKEYTVGDETIKWNGLANTDKISLLAYYVYYKYAKNKASQLTNLGQVRPVVENSAIADPSQVLSSAWHNLRRLYGYSGQNSLIPSAYNFLTEHESDYSEWVFTRLGSVNTFDL